jgi:hypothetical protein
MYIRLALQPFLITTQVVLSPHNQFILSTKSLSSLNYSLLPTKEPVLVSLPLDILSLRVPAPSGFIPDRGLYTYHLLLFCQACIIAIELVCVPTLYLLDPAESTQIPIADVLW